MLLDRGRVRLATGGAWLLAAFCLLLLATTHNAVASWTLLLVLTGAALSGGQLCVNVLGSIYYPAAMRATGLSWMEVVGDIGAICGPLAGAFMLAHAVPVHAIFAWTILPVGLCAGAALLARPSWVEG